MKQPVSPRDLYQMRFVNGIAAFDGGCAFNVYSPVPGGYHTALYIWDSAKGTAAEARACENCRILGSVRGRVLLALPDGMPGYLRPDGSFTRIPGAEGLPAKVYPLASGALAYCAPLGTRSCAGGLCFEELPFRSDGKKLSPGCRTALYLTENGIRRALTPPEMEVSSVALSESGRYLAYCGCVYHGVRPSANGLYLYDAETGRTAVLCAQTEGLTCSRPCFMGEDALFYATSPGKMLGESPRFFRYALQSGVRTALPFADMTLDNGLISDAAYGEINGPLFAEGRLLFTSPARLGPQLYQMDESGVPAAFTALDGGVLGFAPAGRGAVFSALTGNALPELYYQESAESAPCRITYFNDAYSGSRIVCAPKHFLWRNRDGLELDGWLLSPPDYTESGRYPGIMAVHGGPSGLWNGTFFHELQCLAAAGFLVFYTNPRGSSGRCEAFRRLSDARGRADLRDLTDFAVQLPALCPQLDAKRLGISGGSYGGFVCNWMLAHTELFAAAVSQRSISNYATKILCSDIGYSVSAKRIGADLWEDFGAAWDASPLKYAERIHAPVLFLHSERDYCCTAAESIQLYHALKRRGVDTALMIFADESHGLSRTGKPENRIRRIERMIDWFKAHL